MNQSQSKRASSGIKYIALGGYFEHYDEPPGPDFRADETTSPGLGLINRSYSTDDSFDVDRTKTQWERFVYFLSHQNQIAPQKAQYKLFYLTRHGQGYHNIMESAVGRQEWESYWARLDGNDTMTWADSRLTAEGIRQAQTVNAFWRDAFLNCNVPPPEKYYASPLARCLETARINFAGLDFPQDRPFKPVVRELLRERLGVHTCDRRSTRSWIRHSYPDYEIDPDLTEEDELWSPDKRESFEEQVDRTKQVLDDIFSSEPKTIISFEVHSGTIHALYAATQHKDIWVKTGAVVPILIKAEFLEDETELG